MKKPQVKIAASLMCADPLNLQRDITILKICGVDALHLDVMDGHFVPNITLGPESIHKISSLSALPKEVHLLVCQPERFINALLPLLPQDTIIFHRETVADPSTLVADIKKHNVRVGIAYSPETKVERVEGVDQILIMTARPGFKGKTFIKSTKTKFAKIRKLYAGITIDMEADGAINVERIKELYPMGVNVFVAGSSTIFRNANIHENARHLYHQLIHLGIR